MTEVYITNLSSIDDVKEAVGLTHYMPFDDVEGLGKTREELEQNGHFIDHSDMPTSQHQPYKTSMLCRNKVTGELFFEYLDRPLTQEEKIKKITDGQLTATDKYNELVNGITPITDLKTAKMRQLDEMCNITIVNGFEHTVGTTEYLFSCSLSAQANFQGTDTLFKDGFITETEWTAINTTTGDVVRVPLNQTEFNSLKLKVFQHINSNISKFRNVLQPQVEAATTNAEVDAVNW